MSSSSDSSGAITKKDCKSALANMYPHAAVVVLGDGLCMYRAFAKSLGIPPGKVMEWVYDTLKKPPLGFIEYLCRGTQKESTAR